MSTTTIGEIRLQDGRKYKVKWDEKLKHVYVSWGGWKYIGKARSAKDAIEKAKEYLKGK